MSSDDGPWAPAATAAPSAGVRDRPVLVPRARLRLDRHGEHALLLYPERCLVLNESAFEILRLCDGARTVGQIAAHLSARQAGAPDAVARDLSEFLEAMVEKGLVVFSETDD